MMPPGTTPRSTPAAVGGASGIFFGRVPVVVRVVPIRAPFVNVVSQIAKPVGAWSIQTHRLRPAFPSLGVIRKPLRRSVSPRIHETLGAAAPCAFPLRFRRQSIVFSRCLAQPIAIAHRLVPENRHTRHLPIA